MKEVFLLGSLSLSLSHSVCLSRPFSPSPASTQFNRGKQHARHTANQRQDVTPSCAKPPFLSFLYLFSPCVVPRGQERRPCARLFVVFLPSVLLSVFSACLLACLFICCPLCLVCLCCLFFFCLMSSLPICPSCISVCRPFCLFALPSFFASLAKVSPSLRRNVFLHVSPHFPTRVADCWSREKKIVAFASLSKNLSFTNPV